MLGTSVGPLPVLLLSDDVPLAAAIRAFAEMPAAELAAKKRAAAGAARPLYAATHFSAQLTSARDL